jgi:hypothetical protein
MIRIIIELTDALDEDYLQISREFKDCLKEMPYNFRYQSELVTDSHREVRP